MIASMKSTSDLVADKEDDVVVEFHQKKRKGYVEETRLKYVPFANGNWKTSLVCLFLFRSLIYKKMTWLELFIDLFPRDQLNLILTLTNAEKNDDISSNNEMIYDKRFGLSF